MTREEIIKGLLDIHAVTANYKGDQVIIHSMPMTRLTAILNGAVELLNMTEQVAVKPDYNFDTGGRYGRCPACRTLVRSRSGYCWNCGQRFKWEG